MQRRQFLKSAATMIGASAAVCGGALPQELLADNGSSFTFAHLTDIHVQPELGAPEGFRQCIDAVNRLDPKPDFVITGGDLIMDALAVGRERLDVQWKIFDEACRNFELPVHHTIGNHDVIGWSSKAQISSTDPDYGKKYFAERYGQGRTYRSFDHKGWHFILLDSIGQAPDKPDYIWLIDDAQLEWLKKDLEKTGKTTPIVIVTHIPFYSIWHQVIRGPGAPVEPNGLITNVFQFRKMLEPYNIKLVLSGHGHIRERIEVGRSVYIQSGAVCGMWWKGKVFGDDEAFGVVRCEPDSFAYRYQSFGWQARKPG